MAEKNTTPDLDHVMGAAEDQERKARVEREDQVRQHNEQVLEAHAANATLQTELADRAVAYVPVAYDGFSSWLGKYGPYVLGGAGGAASLWSAEWVSNKLREILRGRRGQK